MQRWEYKEFAFAHIDFSMDFLNKHLGNKGWEICYLEFQEEPKAVHIIAKRRLGQS